MRILKEEAEIKETLPVSFVTDMMSKGWDEVGYLREASAAIKETYKDTAKIEELMQDLMDAYLVFIGQLELYLHDEENIVASAAETTTEETGDEEIVSKEAIKVDDKKLEKPMEAPKPELPEADFEIDPISEPVVSSAEAKVSEPFEFFVDFDEPDLTQPAITDAELYNEEPEEVKRQLNG